MKNIRKAIVIGKLVPFYTVLLCMVLISACETNEDADRISVTPQQRPTIVTVEPAQGRFGDEVIISGTHFDPQIIDNTVTLNGTKAVIKSVTPTSLVFVVPQGASTGPIQVSVLNFQAQGPTFTVLAPLPIISEITPLSAGVGESITISGEHFGADIADNTVSFNGTMGHITMASPTSITVVVPEGATSGPISITAPGGTVESSTTFEVLVITTLSIPLTSNDDDVEEVAVDFGEPVGTMDLGSSDLEFGEISSGQGLMNIGLRFNNVTIPQGSTVTEAYIQFKTDNDGSDPVELTVYGESTANAAPYVGDLGELSARALTTASVVWNIDPWVNEGDRGDAQKTVNIAAIVQEIVNRSDWAPGNSINIIMKHTGVSTGASSSSGGREAENYSSSKPDDGAELTVVFQ
ncbi:MAG: IPT/TIG domain-containing protein [Flavobacteriaceae bacterium]